MTHQNYNKNTTDNQEELLWEVDENDTPIGPVTRKECHNETRKPWHRSTHVYLFDEHGNIYFTKRSASKDTAAGQWTVSAAGHIQYGDSAIGTATREVMEELNIKVELTQIDKLKIDYGTEKEIIEIFAGVTTDTPEINLEEVGEIKLFDFDEISNKFLNKEFDLSGGSRDTFKHTLNTCSLIDYRADHTKSIHP